MNVFAVKLRGRTPLLMSRWDIEGMFRTRGKSAPQPPPAEAAKKARYLTADGEDLMVPVENLRGCLQNVAKGFKGPGRSNMSPWMGLVDLFPEEVRLDKGPEGYKVDTRTARNKVTKQGIVVSRPLIYPWDLWFVLAYLEDDIGSVQNAMGFRAMWQEAGRRVGLCAFRPSNGGRFGRFRVDEFKAIPWETITGK